MSDQDGRYGAGMPFSNRLVRQGPSHQTSRAHVRVDLLPARLHKVATLFAAHYWQQLHGSIAPPDLQAAHPGFARRS